MADAPRLFLITPRLADGTAFEPLLRAALEAADVACLLIRTAARDEHAAKTIVRSLAPIAQAQGAAVLVEDDARLAARLDLDGVHMTGPGEAFDAALESLRPGKIVGVGGLVSRDMAMAAGERGADYLMFGAPGEEDHQAIRDRVAWWAEIFNVPCVGYATQPDRARDMAAAGAEFVALCDGVWDAPDPIGVTLDRMRAGMEPVEVR